MYIAFYPTSEVICCLSGLVCAHTYQSCKEDWTSAGSFDTAQNHLRPVLRRLPALMLVMTLRVGENAK